MAVRALDIPDGTLQAIQQLADITGVEDRDRLAKLLLDALRTYEWILYQQVTGKIVAALGQPEVELLEHTEEIDVDREFLTSLIAPGRQTSRGNISQQRTDSLVGERRPCPALIQGAHRSLRNSRISARPSR